MTQDRPVPLVTGTRACPRPQRKQLTIGKARERGRKRAPAFTLVNGTGRGSVCHGHRYTATQESKGTTEAGYRPVILSGRRAASESGCCLWQLQAGSSGIACYPQGQRHPGGSAEVGGAARRPLECRRRPGLRTGSRRGHGVACIFQALTAVRSARFCELTP